MKQYRWLVVVCAVVVLAVPSVLQARDKTPRRFRNYKQIVRALEKSEFQNAYGALDRRVAFALGQPELALDAVLPAAAALADAVAGTASTGTNIQVAGVDEADLVKTDGTYLYMVSGNRLAIVRGAVATAAADVTPLELISTVDFGTEGFVPSELHLYGTALVVIGMAYDYTFLSDPIWTDPVAVDVVSARMMPIRACTARTVVQVYDVSDPAAPVKTRSVAVEGSHLTSRRVGQYLYVVARSYPYFEAMALTARRSPGTGLVPRVSDSLDGDEMRDLLPREVSLLPDCYEASYLVVAALDLGSAAGDFAAHAFLGAGNIVYATAESLYVASSSWFWRPMMIMAKDGEADVETPRETVTLYRFALQGTAVNFAARGVAPGRILNSFSMDERDGVFRIATTAYPTVWTDAAETSGVYTFDRDLKPLGKVDGLAPGERIYAARFIGSRCYLVTFETIDPLFVIDVADPAAPAVLGTLKIPGYSAYLHPFDETHLIGFGKDVQMVQTPWSGEAGVPMEQGLKVALFDVSDVANPIEQYAEYIGVRGSDSEALRDHHAFVYDATRNLLAFPCTVREFVDPQDPADPWWWGDFVFQGILAFRLTAEAGFEPLGGVTHMDADMVDVWDAPWERYVRRGLVLGEVLHSVSEGMVKANAVADMAELSVLELPSVEPSHDDPVVYWLLTPTVADEASMVPASDMAGLPEDPAGNDGDSSAASTFGALLRGFVEAIR